MAYSELDRGWSACFDERRRTARDLARRAGVVLDGSAQDVSALQKILDARAVGRADRDALAAVDLAFADAVAFALRLDWVLITDQFGTSPSLRIEDTDWCVGPLRMLSSRLRKGERVDVRALYENLLVTLARELHAQPRHVRRLAS